MDRSRMAVGSYHVRRLLRRRLDWSLSSLWYDDYRGAGNLLQTLRRKTIHCSPIRLSRSGSLSIPLRVSTADVHTPLRQLVYRAFGWSHLPRSAACHLANAAVDGPLGKPSRGLCARTCFDPAFCRNGVLRQGMEENWSTATYVLNLCRGTSNKPQWASNVQLSV